MVYSRMKVCEQGKMYLMCVVSCCVRTDINKEVAMTVEVVKFSGPISHTRGRFIYDNGIIYDKLKEVEVKPNDFGLYFLEKQDGIFAEGITIEFAFCYSYYQFKGTKEEFQNVDYITDGTGKLVPKSIKPYFNIESHVHDGLNIIPGYSDYCISMDGRVLYNVNKCTRKKIHKDQRTGRYQTTVVGDNGLANTVFVARLVALAWLKYTFEDQLNDVDHINEIRTDDHYSNLQFLSNSDNLRKQVEYRNSFRVCTKNADYRVIDLDDPKRISIKFTQLKAVAKFIGCRSSAVLKHFDKVDKTSVIHNRWVVWDHRKTPPPNLFKCEENRYSSSKGFRVKGTCSKTGTVKIFEKVSEILAYFTPDTGITKKTLTTSLKKDNKRLFLNGWFFQYEHLTNN